MLAAHTRHADRLDDVGNSRRARVSWRLSHQVTLGLALLVIGRVRKVGRQTSPGQGVKTLKAKQLRTYKRRAGFPDGQLLQHWSPDSMLNR